MSDRTAGWIGRAMPRREDPRLLSGRGRYVDDIAPAGCLHLALLRNPLSAGRLAALDVSAARAAEGVALVLTGADLAGLGASAVNPLLPEARAVPMQPLAAERVGAAGQPLAAVVARSPEAAQAALELIDFEIEEEAEIADPEVARHGWLAGQVEEAFARAARVVRVTADHALVAPMALEPRAALAEMAEGRLTVWLSTQTPNRCREDLASILGIDRAEIRVIAPDVGGAFGGKASLMPEDVLVAHAARLLDAPVKWRASRSDEFLAATQGRGAETRAALALDGAGRMTALRAELRFPLGHWMPHSALAPARNAGRILPGPYRVAAVDIALTARLMPMAAVNIYRGAGRPEATLLMERLIDRAAEALGIDPLEMRRRQLIAAETLPGRTPTGETLDRGDYAGLLDRLAEVSGYDALRRAQARRRAAGAVCGLGLALYVEPCGQGWETAEIQLLPDGRLRALTGASAQGQGRETAFAQIVAEALGTAPQAVEVVEGDTDRIDRGIGALASRSTAIGGSAMWAACAALKAQARQALAAALGADEVAETDAGFAAGGRRYGWAEIARLLATGDGPVLSASHTHTAEAEAWASGACLAEVALDPDTGVPTVERITWVDDAGRVVNPLLAEGQLIGGLAQGLGAALMERMVHEDGQVLTGSLMDYAVPRASDMPPVRIDSRPVPSAANPLGVKGVGEAGSIGVPAALVNAIQDALIPFGAPDLSLPLTSEKLWRAMTKDRT
ncbi:xanthine dehydrogenase family protein molybdopterin-binding subunit [Acidimangrovimonas pyrenivorans]|uniref:Xanthine dehydrogenase family protein molybdopterin-binding subunit n=1 Tax=Acidimangrovimonas pyrenivorans TaxID=2030798 RepID=A0ABV7AIS8_9RHOB